jgi:hypothetical protein
LSYRLQQQEQTAKLNQQSHQQQAVCGGKALPITLEHRKSNADGNENDCESSGESDNETIELWSNEIPVWIKGEQRWISGVTEQTSCLDLVEALLIDEGIIKTGNDSSNNNSGTNLYPTKVNDYVITERWRRVEQVLEPRTKILKIWAAWGAEQSEVKNKQTIYYFIRILIASSPIMSQLLAFYYRQGTCFVVNRKT